MDWIFFESSNVWKKNWIDFESETSRVIQSIDKDIRKYKADDDTVVRGISVSYFAEYFLDDYYARVQIRDEEFYKSISDKGLPIGKISEYKSEYDEMNPVESKKIVLHIKFWLIGLKPIWIGWTEH